MALLEALAAWPFALLGMAAAERLPLGPLEPYVGPLLLGLLAFLAFE